MKKLFIVVLLFITLSAFAQQEAFIGRWNVFLSNSKKLIENGTIIFNEKTCIIDNSYNGHKRHDELNYTITVVTPKILIIDTTGYYYEIIDENTVHLIPASEVGEYKLVKLVRIHERTNK